jgi:tRNA-splicing ligase RtcB
MMNKINEKIIAFLDPATIEPKAMEQLYNIAEMPFIHRHVAVMPDCHLGKGATVGSVIATKEAIIPAAVGVDIGCGMIAVKTKFFAKDLPDDLEKLRSGIERRIPLSAGAFNKSVEGTATSRFQELLGRIKGADQLNRIEKAGPNFGLAIGTLGSGNHFIEVSLDETDRVWIVLHSGSRGVGNQLAQRHIKVAQKLMDDFHITLKDRDLAYLIEGKEGFDAYISDLMWAQDFARLNRDEMMDRVLKEFSYTMFKEDGHQSEIELERINCHHNFTQKEHHLGEDVWLTRKGAIQMKKGQLGVIPGSMGTRSYIVSGLENPIAYHSAPHGAGRRFSRTEARKRFTLEDMEKAMEGIAHRKSAELIDEIPAAYKDIDQVMENSKELVEVKHVLRQVVNVKGN